MHCEQTCQPIMVDVQNGPHPCFCFCFLFQLGDRLQDVALGQLLLCPLVRGASSLEDKLFVSSFFVFLLQLCVMAGVKSFNLNLSCLNISHFSVVSFHIW